MIVDQTKKTLINFIAGFLLSILGTIPLGFLNLVALQIFSNKGKWEAILFALGVIFVELIVIRLTMSGAKYLIAKQKYRIYIDLFTFLFISGFALAGFLANKNGKTDLDSDFAVAAVHPLLYGIILGCLNPLQIPFWAGWNVYMINHKNLIPEKPFYYFYMIGTAIGTFAGMCIFVLTAKYMIEKNQNALQNTGGKLISWVFLILALWQGSQLIYHWIGDRQKKKSLIESDQ